MENIPTQPALANTPPPPAASHGPSKWPILVILLLIILGAVVIYQTQNFSSKPTPPSPSVTSTIKPPSFKTIKGSVLAVSKDAISVQTSIGTESASLSKAKEILKTEVDGKMASASASEITTGKRVLVLASKDGQSIVSIIILR